MKDTPHYFNTILPIIPMGEPEVFFSHPTLDIKCNQVGVVYFGDSYEEVSYSPNTEKFTISKNRADSQRSFAKFKIVTECYLGEETTRLERKTVNGILTDLRPENVLVQDYQAKGAKLNTNLFIHRSVVYMLEKDKILEDRGIAPQEYWGEFKLPNYIIAKYIEITGTPLIKARDGQYKFSSKKKNYEILQSKKVYKTKEEIKVLCEKVRYLKDVVGKSQGAISTELGIARTLVSYYYHKQN